MSSVKNCYDLPSISKSPEYFFIASFSSYFGRILFIDIRVSGLQYLPEQSNSNLLISPF